MGRIIKTINKQILQKLYWGEGMSLKGVASVLECTDTTVATYMKKLGVPRRDKTTMGIKYKKHPFSGTDEDKAYMLGFRLGDLNVYKPYVNSRIYVIRCHTTHKSQVDLIQKLFEPYGGVKIAFTNNGYTVNCFLDESFEFLHPKEMPGWVFSSRYSVVSSFIAGYVDAEGTFGLNQGRGRFKIDSYDYSILKSIYEFLVGLGMDVKFRMIARQGSRRGSGVWNGSLWRLGINIANELERFIILIKPFMKHKNRMIGANLVLDNIQQRKYNGTIAH